MNKWEAQVITVVPIKTLSECKSRLGSYLDSSQRQNLVLNMLRIVINTVQQASVKDIWVLSNDPVVKKFAINEGAQNRSESGPNINDSLSYTFNQIWHQNCAAMYLPGDIPFIKPDDINGIIKASINLTKIVISPSQSNGGTNGILLPLNSTFLPNLGLNSFQRHLDQGSASNTPTAIFKSSGLSQDLDTLQDMVNYQSLDAHLMDYLVSHNNFQGSAKAL